MKKQLPHSEKKQIPVAAVDNSIRGYLHLRTPYEYLKKTTKLVGSFLDQHLGGSDDFENQLGVPKS